MDWGALLGDAESLMQCGKLHVNFAGSFTDKQWPP